MNLQSIIQHAFERRLLLFNVHETNCFRLFNTDGDGLDGVTIDYYAGYILVQYYWQELWELDNELRAAIVKALTGLPGDVKGVFLKNRTKVKNEKNFLDLRKSIILEGGEPPEDFYVLQNNMKIYADLIDGQSTGIFLDMREVRDKLRNYYTVNDSMLNLFSYTGAFAVHALQQGAKKAINVDLSRTVLNRAKKNYALNGLAVDNRDFIEGDALYWGRRLKRQDQQFSFIVFDPPTFSRNKKQTFSVKQNYAKGLSEIHEIAAGYVLTSVNSHSVSREEYLSYHPANWKLEFFSNESSDFPAKDEPYLKVGLWKV